MTGGDPAGFFMGGNIPTCFPSLAKTWQKRLFL